MKKDKDRNVDAESHLLTGGLITGFLTFMGFLPGAAVSAAATAIAVKNEYKKEEERTKARIKQEIETEYYKDRSAVWYSYYMHYLYDTIATFKTEENTFLAYKKQVDEMYKSAREIYIPNGSEWSTELVFKRDENSEEESIPKFQFDFYGSTLEKQLGEYVPLKLVIPTLRKNGTITCYVTKHRGELRAMYFGMHDQFEENCKLNEIDPEMKIIFIGEKELSEKIRQNVFNPKYDRGEIDNEGKIRTRTEVEK